MSLLKKTPPLLKKDKLYDVFYYLIEYMCF
nr:MAG TPA: hypothetical protein [Caudoviricetes sp.]